MFRIPSFLLSLFPFFLPFFFPTTTYFEIEDLSGKVIRKVETEPKADQGDETESFMID